MRVQHIDAAPSTPEPYYKPTGKEVQPRPVGEDDGMVIFQYHPMSAVNYFSRSTSKVTRLPSIPPVNGDLKFESRFESGNLAKAVKITDTYYELSLRTDMYTNKHVQWFYFMVENMKKGVHYRFSLVNLSKGDSLYNSGMKPVMYSTKDAVLNKVGWKRCGTNIAYYRNDPPFCCRPGEEDCCPTFTLSFQIEFPHDEDCVYLAHSYPYTYTDLQEYLIKLQNHPTKSIHTRLRLLCKTLAGNCVYFLTITEPPLSSEETFKKKKAVVVTARVHPGETPSSWIMKGLIDYITGDSVQAQELRSKFIFKIVPMLNPDGVIVGNSRCSLTGRDLNRQYRTVIRECYPSVWNTKMMVKKLIDECGVAMYCDIHAHSRRHNAFIYGCENKTTAELMLQEQVFPLMLHKNSADKFCFESCRFRVQRNKEGTGRVVMWNFGVLNSYTMEASFAGSTLGSRAQTHFTTQDYESIGRSFCETLLDFVDTAPSKERLRAKIVSKLQKEGSSADEPANISLSEYSSDDGDVSDEGDPKDLNRLKGYPTVPPPSPAPEDKSVKIPCTVLDLESNEGFSSGDEGVPSRKSSLRRKRETRSSLWSSYKGTIGPMPPELMVRPAKASEMSNYERIAETIIKAQYQEVDKMSKKEDRNSFQEYFVKPSRPPLRRSAFSAEELITVRTQRVWSIVPTEGWVTPAPPNANEILRPCPEKVSDLKKEAKSLKKIKKSTKADKGSLSDAEMSSRGKSKPKKKTKRRIKSGTQPRFSDEKTPDNVAGAKPLTNEAKSTDVNFCYRVCEQR